MRTVVWPCCPGKKLIFNRVFLHLGGGPWISCIHILTDGRVEGSKVREPVQVWGWLPLFGYAQVTLPRWIHRRKASPTVVRFQSSIFDQWSVTTYQSDVIADERSSQMGHSFGNRDPLNHMPQNQNTTAPGWFSISFVESTGVHTPMKIHCCILGR